MARGDPSHPYETPTGLLFVSFCSFFLFGQGEKPFKIERNANELPFSCYSS